MKNAILFLCLLFAGALFGQSTGAKLTIYSSDYTSVESRAITHPSGKVITITGEQLASAQLETCNERGHYWEIHITGIMTSEYRYPTLPELIDEPDRTILRVWSSGYKERCKRCGAEQDIQGSWSEKIIWSRNNMKQ
jgi:hypothetical protein